MSGWFYVIKERFYERLLLFVPPRASINEYSPAEEICESQVRQDPGKERAEAD